MNWKNFVRFLIVNNKELVRETALKNCHCIGLNSFIINEKPRIRLFVAEKGSDLHRKFDPQDPVIPVHPHKYDDQFVVLHGVLTNHIYKQGLYDKHFLSQFKLFRFSYKRIINGAKEPYDPKIMSCDWITYFKKDQVTGEYFQPASTLHTVSVPEGIETIWIVIEMDQSTEFDQLAYMNGQKSKRRDRLYLPFKENPIEYLGSKLFI